ncbi:hypothetical protein GGF37_002352 [Kickxella alabastrina]|nr:hypothetical protein GGF37_002352 [Kickxella alabastrina]
MALFMQAVCGPLPTDEGGASLPVSYRLSARRRPKVDRDGPRVRLQEAVIVGNRPTQIKFSELTLDMYYMLQMLEREPTNVSAKDGAKEPEVAPAATDEGSAVADSTAVSPEAAGVMTADAEKKLEGAAQAGDAEKEKEKADIAGDKDSERDKIAVGRRNNPHKYVLYQPHFSQIQVYLANAFREIGEQGCVLLYLSSEGSSAKPATEISTAAALSHGFIGGISTTRRSTGETKDRSIEQLVHTVHPADLLPYTRKPFFLIVESESSGAYLNMPNLFNQPLLCLLSPTAYPVSSSSGSIYTFFLHSPVIAFCIISQVTMMTGAKWSEVQRMFDALEDRVFELLLAKVTDARVRKFLGDDFLRQMVARHVICCVTLGLHVEFSRPEHLPKAEPERFEAVVEDSEVIGLVREIVAACGVEALYSMAEKVQSRSPSPAPSVASAVSPTVPEAADAETAVSGLVSEEPSSPQ